MSVYLGWNRPVQLGVADPPGCRPTTADRNNLGRVTRTLDPAASVNHSRQKNDDTATLKADPRYAKQTFLQTNLIDLDPNSSQLTSFCLICMHQNLIHIICLFVDFNE